MFGFVHLTVRPDLNSTPCHLPAFALSPDSGFGPVPGDPLLRVPEGEAGADGYVPVRGVLPERWAGGRGALAAAVRHHRDQAPLQHVHVQGLAGPKAHLFGRQVCLVRRESSHHTSFLEVKYAYQISTYCISLFSFFFRLAGCPS